MNVLYSILSFTIVLGIIVLVHEFGHYIAARLIGVRVEVFSFGFGKRIFGKKIGDTDFRLSPIPLGGYVKMAGEEEFDPENLKPDDFNAKNRAQKIFILLMGPVMNLVLTFVIFTIIYLNGVTVPDYHSYPPKIGYISKGSPAEEAGIKKGDLIISIDEQTIENWEDLEINILSNPNQKLPVQIKRGENIINTSISIKSRSKHNVGDAGLYWGFNAKILEVVPNSPASKAGLKNGDLITAIDNMEVCFNETHNIISNSPEKPLMITIKRGDKILEKPITPNRVYYWESQSFNTIEDAKKKLEEMNKNEPEKSFIIDMREGLYIIRSETMDHLPAQDSLYSDFHIAERGRIGVNLNPYIPFTETSYSFVPAMGRSVHKMVNLIDLVFRSVRKMIVGKLSTKNLSGPIEIAKFSQQALETGAYSFFMLIAFISLQLGLINLLPIPAFDGGHLMIFTIESIIRRDFSQKVKNILMNIGFILLIVLMVFIILNDIAKNLPNGWKSLLPF